MIIRLGFGSLMIIVVCMVGSIVVLVTSDDVSQNSWPKKIAPNVILSGLNNVANIFFTVAIANGIAIAWWRRALKGSTIEQLHKS